MSTLPNWVMNMYAMKDCENRDHQNSKTARRLNKRLICRRNRDLVKAKINSFLRSYQTLVHFSFKWVLVTSWSTICGMLSSIHSSIIGDSPKREQKKCGYFRCVKFSHSHNLALVLLKSLWHSSAMNCYTRDVTLERWNWNKNDDAPSKARFTWFS